MEKSLQEIFAAKSICFGCGPANEMGLKIGTFPVGEKETIAHFTPKPYQQAFPGVLNGVIIGSLLDCHSNWTACWWLMKQGNLSEPPCTVTSEYSVKLRRPTPANQELTIKARVASSEGDKVTIEAELLAGEKVCATCKGVFVAVKPEHPAYHSW